MTNREKIHRAFDALQLAEPIQLEEKRMNRFMPKRSLVALCAAILVLGSLSIAYAADLGGFRETLTVWFGGKKQEASVQEIAPGVVEWTGEDGESHLVGGVDDDGPVRGRLRRGTDASGEGGCKSKQCELLHARIIPYFVRGCLHPATEM